VPDIAGYANGYEIVLGGVSSPDGGAPVDSPAICRPHRHSQRPLNERVGYLNPTLYSHHAAGIFHDIADGRTNATGGAPDTSRAGWEPARA